VTISPATAARPTGAAAQILTDSESEERNMNLEQLREMMDTDARKRAEAQEQTIKELHKTIKQLREENRALRDELSGRKGGGK
jgi:exonuclease VII large subunit